MSVTNETIFQSNVKSKQMNRIELYTQTVNDLFTAYDEGELKHGQSCACAAGNICARAAQGFEYGRGVWAFVFSVGFRGTQRFHKVPNNMNDLMSYDAGKRLIERTGYTIEELARIEYAFESSIFDAELSESEFHKVYRWQSRQVFPLAEKGSRAYYMYIEPEKGQFLGLCAVLEVLKSIHGIDHETNRIDYYTLKTIAHKHEVLV